MNRVIGRMRATTTLPVCTSDQLPHLSEDFIVKLIDNRDQDAGCLLFPRYWRRGIVRQNLNCSKVWYVSDPSPYARGSPAAWSTIALHSTKGLPRKTWIISELRSSHKQTVFSISSLHLRIHWQERHKSSSVTV